MDATPDRAHIGAVQQLTAGRVAGTQHIGAGLAVAAVGATFGVVVHRVVPSVSPHVVAVLVGVVLANAGIDLDRLRPGLRVASRRVLRIGIVLLGVRLSVGEVADLGPRALAAVVIVVTCTFVGTQLLGRWLGLSRGLSLLVATGYSICGASAIAAAEPFSDATDEEVACSIGLVTICGSLAIAVLPLIGAMLGMSDAAFGAWAGASVHDVGQVVAAASTAGSTAVSVAVVVKLTRVVLLAPLLAGVALQSRRRTPGTGAPARPPVLPLFVALFLGAVVLRSVGAVPGAWIAPIRQAETVLIGMGLVGLGSGVDIRRLRGLGPRPLVLGLLSWLLVAGVALAAVTITAV